MVDYPLAEYVVTIRCAKVQCVDSQLVCDQGSMFLRQFDRMKARQVVGVDFELVWADRLWRLEDLPDVK